MFRLKCELHDSVFWEDVLLFDLFPQPQLVIRAFISIFQYSNVPIRTTESYK